MSKSLSVATLVLRFLALILLGASIFVLATDKVTLSDGIKTTFKDFITYRYVIATAIIGFIYCLIQVPFAIYYLAKEKRLIRNGCLPEFDFYADKVIAFLLATGAGAGFAVTIELKKLIRDFLKAISDFGGSEVSDFQSEADKFFNRANIANGLLFLAFLCVAVQSVISSLEKKNASSSRGFFG